MNLENTVKKASLILKNHNIHSYELDAQIILSDIMGMKREFLITNNEINISEKVMKKYDIAIKRRIKREPVAYIIGKKEFWSQDFRVNNSTLIPRPESELLIYKLVSYFENRRINILDIGTGSGCILLSLLKELPLTRGIGIDISAKAVKTAKSNSKKLNLFFRSKFKVVDIDNFNIGRYDLIVANPPYIALKDMKNLSKDILNYEPLIALKGGYDGLDLIKKVIYKSKHLLKANGLLGIEVGTNQYVQASKILKKNGFREVSKEYDCNYNVRCIISTKT
uniref:Release factor glutamine methyltransferase n=1 Tax=uncultured marine bacterium 440 TaxID=257390 RepID=Q6SHD0_9BACT|nr:modification methylase, HemK family [uncultured marine bacterium 440]